MDKKRIIFIMNPISGTISKAGIPEIIKHTLDHDKFDYEIKYTERAGHATEIAQDAMRNNIDIVVAVGGDGTVNEVAKAIVHSNTALGIIPCGSGNGLARHLMLPINIKKSIQIINECEIHDLDFGVINNFPFFCTCGMGFDAFVSMKFAESGKRGPITYVENVLREGLKYKPETYTIEDETGTKRYEAFLISIANASQYGNNAYIAPQASMSDGVMDVIIMEPFDVLEAPQVSFDMFNKTLNKNSRIKTFTCKELHIHRSKPGVIHYDGDPVMTGKDIDVKLHEKGIKIIVNPHANKNKRQPNVVQTAFTEFFNQIHDIRCDLKKDINKSGKRIEVLSRAIQRKLNL
jgi:YegS/Rv2252/BmrU family lipid kinase